MKKRNFRKIISFLWNTVFPLEESILILHKMAEQNELDSLPKAGSVENLPWITAIFKYRDETVRKLIWQIKYRGDEFLIENIAEILYERLVSEISEDFEYGETKKFILIPVPMSKKRRRERGFNQTELICKNIFKIDDGNFLEYNPKIILRKNALKQTEMKKEDRLLKISGQFSVALGSEVKNRNCILIDDVVTTGATLKEMRKVLKESGAKNIRGFAIAH